MRKTIIIGNWKMNKNSLETEKFFNEFNSKKILIKENLIYGIALPSINIPLAQKLKNEEMAISAQDISEHEKGAYTGEISALMLNSFNVSYVVIGHSERRMYHGESDFVVNNKAKIALKNSIIPIICVGETLGEYEKGDSKKVVEKQVKESLKDLDLSKVVVAYEPVWAIGTGKTATFEYAQEMCSFIRSLTSDKTLIQYGGSVNGENIDKLLEQKDIDGALVGGASLEVESFIKLISK